MPPESPPGAPHELRKDAPRLDATRDVDAHVAVERRTNVVRSHCRRDTDCGGLVAATRVERARNLALLVEDVAALLDAARDEHVAVHAEEVLAVEAGFTDLGEGADGLGFAGDRHRAQLYRPRPKARPPPAASIADLVSPRTTKILAIVLLVMMLPVLLAVLLAIFVHPAFLLSAARARLHDPVRPRSQRLS